jgi:ketosteroid isomerase-like protein
MEQTDSDLLRRIERIEDRQKIEELNFRYCLATDDRDFEALASLYSADSVFDAPYGRVQGPEQIVKYLKGRLSVYGPTIHTSHGHLIEFGEPEHARGVVAAHMEVSFDGEVTGIAAMRYLDQYVRDEGEWRFRERLLRFHYLLPWADMPESLSGALRIRPPGRDRSAADLPEGLETWRSSRPGDQLSTEVIGHGR